MFTLYLVVALVGIATYLVVGLTHN